MIQITWLSLPRNQWLTLSGIFRHYGILSNRNKNKLREIQFLMGIIVDKKEKKSWQEISKEKLHFDPVVCPHCGIGHFITISSWNGRAPPKRFVQNKGI